MTVLAHRAVQHSPRDKLSDAPSPPSPWRIRSSLALLVVACMLPGMLLSGYFIVAAYYQQKAHAVRDALAKARAVAATLDRDLKGVESGLRVLATSATLDSEDFAAFDSQARSALPYQGITNYVLLDESGRQRVNTLLPWGSSLPQVGGPPALLQVFDKNHAVLTDVFIGPVARKPILAMAVPVKRGSKTVYSLAAGLFPERIAGVLNAQNLPPAWIAAVLDGQGHIAARNVSMQTYIGKRGGADLVKAASESREGIIETITLEGIPVITAFSRSNLFDWKVAVGVPVEVLTTNLKRSMLLLLATSAIVFAMALIVAWRLVMYRIVTPAESLLVRMRHMSRGEDPGPSHSGQTSQEFAALDEGLSDMSVRLRQREQEREAKMAAEAANRAKTEFLSRMSHELRTPLNAVLGFAQVLKLDPQETLSPRQSEMVDHIESAGHHLLAMISDVLDVSRIEAGTLPIVPTDVDLHEIVAECRQMVLAQATTARLHMVMSMPRGSAVVVADRTRLKQVLINLLSNAIKYNRPHGEVSLKVQQRGRDWRILVRDTGIGMTPDQMTHLFEPFNRLGRESNGTPGTGIGLVICKRLLELMHSTLQYTSATDAGSTFWFDLPRVDAPAVRSEQVLTPVTPIPTSSDLTPRQVLYVEDNATNRNIMHSMLALRPQLRLQFANGVQAAKQTLQTAQFDLVLLDMHLPDGAGLDLLAWMRQQPAHQTVPVIVVSADVASESIAQARQAGAWAYLHKPLDLPHTLEMLDAVLNLGHA